MTKAQTNTNPAVASASVTLQGEDYGIEHSGQLPVLLIHGYPLDGSMWREQVAALRGTRRVLVPDLRGAGRSPPGTGPATMDAMADDVAAMLDRLAVREVDLCGFSMGGYVALAFVLRHPQRVRKLALIDTRAEADTAEGREKRMVMLAKVHAEGMAPLVAGMLPGMLTPHTWAKQRPLVEEVRALMMRQPVGGVEAMIQGLAQRPDRTPRLAEIRSPTLIVVGAEDHITPPEAAKAMAAAIAGSRLVVVPAAAHLVPLEKSAELNAVLVPFLAS